MKIIGAVSMEPDKGLAMPRQYAKELDASDPAAGASMREGLTELFTVGKLGIVGTLAKSLRNTNGIESSHSLINKVTSRVKNWSSQQMATRWHATACVEAEKRMRAVRGCKDLPLLIAALQPEQAAGRKAG